MTAKQAANYLVSILMIVTAGLLIWAVVDCSLWSLLIGCGLAVISLLLDRWANPEDYRENPYE